MRRLVCFSITLAVCITPEALALPKQDGGNTVRGLQRSADQKQLWIRPEVNKKVTQQFIARLKKEASANDALAQASLAMCYHEGYGVPRDLAKAAEWYQKAADKGHAGAQNNLAALYDEGSGVPRDPEKAHQLYLSAARQSFMHAQFNVGLNYALGIVVKQNWEEAANWYRKAASQGYIPAFNNLGNIYLLGRGVPADMEMAKKYLRVPAEAGIAVSQFGLGAALAAQQNFTAAAHWFRLSAKGGYVPGQFYWAAALFEGKGTKRDVPEALTWAHKAAAQGFVEAQAMIAQISFGETDKTLTNPESAERWARKAAEQGNPRGQQMLGLCYDRGFGIERDYAAAAQWYTRAAEQKEPTAAFILGTWFERGQHVPVSFKEAAKWYRVAAEAGNAAAQYQLGLFYRDGTGVDIDLAEAEKWLRLAVAQSGDNPDARAALVEVERQRSNQPAVQGEIDFYRGMELAKQGEQGADTFGEAADFFRKAASAGHLQAQAILAGMYRRGQGVPQSDTEAETLIRKLESRSEPEVLHLLGMSYHRPTGGISPKDTPRAVSFFQRAAVQGYAPAQNSLGFALMSGVGVEFDFVEAFKWLTIAAEQGNQNAKVNLDNLRPMLKGAEVEEGKRRAAGFRPDRQKGAEAGR